MSEKDRMLELSKLLSEDGLDTGKAGRPGAGNAGGDAPTSISIPTPRSQVPKSAKGKYSQDSYSEKGKDEDLNDPNMDPEEDQLSGSRRTKKEKMDMNIDDAIGKLKTIKANAGNVDLERKKLGEWLELAESLEDPKPEKITEAYDFKAGQVVKYQNKDWTVSDVTKAYVELKDKRGLSKIVDFGDIKSFKGGKLIAESQKVNRISELNGFLNEDGKPV